MNRFTYTRPDSPAQVIELLEADSIRPLAGGTDLLTLMKNDIASPNQLVDIKRLAISDKIESREDGVEIGALTRLSDVERSDLLAERLPHLVEAVSQAATPQLRNMATVGGNLLQRPRCWYFRNELIDCWLKGGESCPAREGQNQFHAIFETELSSSPCVAVHPSDLATALLISDASLRILGPGGERSMAVEDFFAIPEEGRRRETTLKSDELILSLRIPWQAEGSRSHYLKAMDRKVWAFALVSVAASIRLEAGRIEEVRLALGGVAPIPRRLSATESLLTGEEADEGLFERAADRALEESRPLELNGYKVPLARSLIRRALSTLLAT